MPASSLPEVSEWQRYRPFEQRPQLAIVLGDFVLNAFSEPNYMRSDELDFCSLKWRGNRFTVERGNGTLVLIVHELVVQDEVPRLVRLCFNETSDEWAMLWDSQVNQWKQHPEQKAPLGEAIVEAFVKASGVGLLFSFAGNHRLGWSRWGFTAKNVQEC